MRYSVDYVDWDKLQRLMARGGVQAVRDAAETDDDPYTMGDDDVGGDSMTFNEMVSETFEAVRPDAPEDAGDALADFLGPICHLMHHDYPPPMDMQLDDEVAIGLWSPESTRRHAERWRRVNVDAVAAAIPEGADVSPDEFTEYVAAWGALFERAASEGKGVRTSIA